MIDTIEALRGKGRSLELLDLVPPGPMDEFIAENDKVEGLELYVEGLKTVRAQLQDGTMWLMQNGMSDFNNAGASSHDYLHLMGLTALAYMWARMAKVSLEKAYTKDPFYAAKLATGLYFVERMMPETAAHLENVKTVSGAMMAVTEAQF